MNHTRYRKTDVIRVGIDLDGVVADFIDSYTSFCRQNYGKEAFTTVNNPFSRYNLMPEYHGSQEEFSKMYNAWKGQRNVYETIPAINQDDMRDLRIMSENKATFNIAFLTARDEASKGSDHTQLQSSRWLYDRGISSPAVFVAKDKRKLCDELELDYLLDDDPKQLNSLIFSKYQTEPVLMRRGYNRTYHHRFHGVDSIEGFVDYVFSRENRKL